jgi:uncharacterized protein YyaL (SSP411 family)
MNKLTTETSPYLLQHADNPVDWHPWSDEALELARAENKPILLSIGYSACHWCHVMAHESFEDPVTAQMMNRLFINIKVDREERPDLDRIYQTAHQLIQRRSGGWPLTMFLDPYEQRPFFGGTYFPKSAGHGLPKFTDLLEKASDYCRDNLEDIKSHGEAIIEAFAHFDSNQPATADALTAQPIHAARETFGEEFDTRNGGFGGAPKFPQPANIDLLLRYWRSTAHTEKPDTDALYICALTLTRMARGGLYDQIGGGFSRYSVDATWTIPHFEKMLYDNGPLLALYAQLWLVSGDDLYRRIAVETADWAQREMLAPEGAFYAALDADSEGEEGLFYVWTPEQLSSILTAEEYAAFSPRFGLDGPPNFESAWHLQIQSSIESLAEKSGGSQADIRLLIESARAKVLAARNDRIWPGRDEKILTSWNALMIRGLAISARALSREDLAATASTALDFIRANLVVEDRLLATWKDGRARFNAYLDDHAFLLDATLELLQARWNREHLEFAIWLADRLLDKFQDHERGGFFYTSDDHEKLIYRTKPMSDDASPSGNGIAALALNRLGHLLGETRYLDAAEATLTAGWQAISDLPHGHTALVAALEEYLAPPEIVIVRGNPTSMREWSLALDALYSPRRLIMAIPASESGLPANLAERRPQDGTVAYICRGRTCSAPVTSLDSLAAEVTLT